MSSSLPSVKDTYFQHKLLTRIHGKPIYETLQSLATEIKLMLLQSPPHLEAANTATLDSSIRRPVRYLGEYHPLG
jgi:hypothetical protein